MAGLCTRQKYRHFLITLRRDARQNKTLMSPFSFVDGQTGPKKSLRVTLYVCGVDT